MAAEITRQDLISDEALNAPLMLSLGFDRVTQSIEKLIETSAKNKTAVNAADSTAKLTKETNNLSLAQQELIKVQKQIAVAQAKDNDNYQTAIKTLKAVKDATKEKITIGEQDSKTVNAQTASLAQLEAALKKNKDAYKNLATEEQRSSAEGKELLKIIQSQDSQVKSLNGTIGVHTGKVGDYRGQLEGLNVTAGKSGEALGFIAPAATSAATGIYRVVTASLAFIATPIGLAITTVVAAIAPLVSFLTSTGDGTDLVTRNTSALSSAYGVLKDRINEVGKSFIGNDNYVESFLGTLANAADAAGNANPLFKVLTDIISDNARAMKEGAKAGGEYADALDEVETSMRFFDIEAAKEQNIIDRLEVSSRNRSISEKEAIKLGEEATTRQAALTAKRVGYAEQELGALVVLASKRSKILQEEGESESEYALRLAKDLDSKEEDLSKRLAAALIKVEEAKGATIRFDEKIQNQSDRLADMAAAKEAKRAADKEKADLAAEAEEVRRFNDWKKRKEEKAKAAEEEDKEILDSMEADKKERADKQKQDQADAAKAQQLAMAGVAFDAHIKDLKLQIAGTYVQSAGNFIAQNLADEETAKDIKKATATVEIGINLQRELIANAVTAAANPLNAFTFGVAGASQLAVMNALSIARAVAAEVAVLAFKKGTKSAPGGPAIVGEEGMELMESGGKYSLTPNKASLINIPKGAKIFPHAETMKILAYSSLIQEHGINSDNVIMMQEIASLKETIKEYDTRIIRAVENSGGVLFEQGSQLYRAHKRSDGNTKITRLKSMSK